MDEKRKNTRMREREKKSLYNGDAPGEATTEPTGRRGREGEARRGRCRNRGKRERMERGTEGRGALT